MKAAIFDMDGTLVESLDVHIDAYLRVFKAHNISAEKSFIIARFGMTAEEIFREILAAKGLQLDAKKLAKEKYSNYLKMLDRLKPLPGAIGLLTKLREKGIKIAVASGSGRENLDITLEKAGMLEYADAIVSANEVGKGKPDPAVFLKAAEMLGAEPADCVVFEDAVYGIQAAKAGGMKSVGMLTGYATRQELENESPDLILNDLTEFDDSKIEQF